MHLCIDSGAESDTTNIENGSSIVYGGGTAAGEGVGARRCVHLFNFIAISTNKTCKRPYKPVLCNGFAACQSLSGTAVYIASLKFALDGACNDHGGQGENNGGDGETHFDCREDGIDLVLE